MDENSFSFLNDVEDISMILLDAQKLGKDFWERQEIRTFTNSQNKNDYTEILEVVTYLFEDQLPSAIERYKELSDAQKSLLSAFASIAHNMYCETCEEGERIGSINNNQDNFRTRFERQMQLKEERIYPISESKFEDIEYERKEYYSLIAKLEQTLALLNEDDPRYDFAQGLIKDIFL